MSALSNDVTVHVAFATAPTARRLASMAECTQVDLFNDGDTTVALFGTAEEVLDFLTAARDAVLDLAAHELDSAGVGS